MNIEGTVTIPLADYLLLHEQTQKAITLKEKCRELLQEANTEYNKYFKAGIFPTTVLTDLAAVNKKIADKYKLEL